MHLLVLFLLDYMRHVSYSKISSAKYYEILIFTFNFYRAACIAMRILSVRLFVCLSVCHTRDP